MAKLTLSSITSGYVVPATINSNNAAVVAAMEKTLSRDGTSPNNMEADLDMDSNRILNLPEPVADTEPLRVMDVAGSGFSATMAGYATDAAASEAAAAASAVAAASSASSASTSASTATTQASSATSSASAAAASAAAAATSAAQQLFRDVVFKTFADSPITIASTDAGKLFAIDASGGAVSVTLPAIAGLTLSSPWSVSIKKTDSSGNAITINRASTDTIDGATSKVVSSPSAGVTLIPDTDPSPDEWTSASFGATAGNMTVDTFTTGVGFTAGSSTTLTLSASPGTENNTWVFFDGQPQHKSQYTVSGTTMTFSSAIPLGVSEIEVMIGSTLSIGTPADGTVSDAKMTDSTAQTLTDGANVAWSLASAFVGNWTIGGNRTLNNPSGVKRGRTYILNVTQDGTGGRTISFGSNYKGVNGGGVPQPNPAPSTTTTYEFFSPDGTVLQLIAPPVPVYEQYLLVKSGSNLLLSPRGGNLITINGKVEVIPDAGVSLAVGALSNSTLYYVYAYMSSGTMTLEAGVTSHATQAGTNVEIKSGDASRTLVGMCYLQSGAFVYTTQKRLVRSWANEPGIVAFCNGASGSTGSGSPSEISSTYRIEVLLWANERYAVQGSGYFYNDTTPYHAYSYVGLDGANVSGIAGAVYAAVASAQGTAAASYGANNASDGYHYLNWMFNVNGGTCTAPNLNMMVETARGYA